MSLINDALRKAERERMAQNPELFAAQRKMHAASINTQSERQLVRPLMLISCLVAASGIGAFMAQWLLFSKAEEPTPIDLSSLVLNSYGDEVSPTQTESQPSHTEHNQRSQDFDKPVAIQTDLKETRDEVPERIASGPYLEQRYVIDPEIARFLAQDIRIQMVIPSSNRILVASADSDHTQTVRSGEMIPGPYLVYFVGIEEGSLVFSDARGRVYRKGF